jgi:hypothetical protein
MSSLKKLISSPCSSNWYSVSLCVREKRGLIKATFITKDALSYPSDLQKKVAPSLSNFNGKRELYVDISV